MAVKWPLKTIAECASDEPYSTQIGPFGKALTPAEYTESGVPLLRGVNVNHGRFHDDDFVFISEETANRLAKFESLPGDVLLVHKGTLGKIGLMPEKRRFHRYIMGNSMLRVRCNPSILIPEYLYYWLSSADGTNYLLSRVSQVGVPQIQQPLTTLRQAKLPVPPLLEQQAVACILGSLDEKIELNQRRNRTLEAMARTIFRSWFVDFDPVRAKPGGLPLDLAQLFPDSFDESVLGAIPKGWRVCPLSEAFHINPARTLAKGTLAPYLDMANMPTQGPSPDSWVMREVGSGMKFINGDTLVARITPCLENGKTAFVDFLREDQVGWGSTEYIVLRPKSSIPPVFAYLLARSQNFRTFAVQQMTGSSGRQRVPTDSLHKYRVAIPENDSPLFSRFGRMVAPMFSQITAAVEQSRALAALRDALLPKLVSGELRVPDAERIVGRAT